MSEPLPVASASWRSPWLAWLEDVKNLAGLPTEGSAADIARLNELFAAGASAQRGASVLRTLVGGKAS